MPSFAQSMRLFEQLLQGNHLEQVKALLRDLLDADGRVHFMSVVSFHDHLCRRYQFVLRKNNTQFVRPGGRHLFYVNGPLLIRVKTSGTNVRPEPHMTVSLAEGLSWPEEAAKFNRRGQTTPRVGAVSTASEAGMWRASPAFGRYCPGRTATTGGPTRATSTSSRASTIPGHLACPDPPGLRKSRGRSSGYPILISDACIWGCAPAESVCIEPETGLFLLSVRPSMTS